MISLDRFAEFRFSLVGTLATSTEELRIMDSESIVSPSNVVVSVDKIAALAGRSILAISNIYSPSGLLSLVHSEGAEESIFLTSQDEEVALGAPISIAYEKRYKKPDSLDRKSFESVSLLAGTIINVTPLDSDEQSFYLSVDFGTAGIEKVTLVDSDSTKITEGRSVVALTNLKKECIHDQTAVLICFKNGANRNIPFSPTGFVENGTRFVI